MNSKIPKTVISLAFTAFLIMGCASAPVNNTVAKSDNILTQIADCTQTLSIVQSPLNKVAPDGFTILYDGESPETLKKLLEQALVNQKASGCKK